MAYGIQLAERGVIPEFLMRYGMRQLMEKRLRFEEHGGEKRQKKVREELRNGPIAINTDDANEQHYTLPDEFFVKSLGPRMKYSCCIWHKQTQSLEDAEIASLQQVAERVDLQDGQTVLELGCGWGSFSLWAAENYPKSNFIGVSNSPTQREFILSRAKERGLDNLDIITCDINSFNVDKKFDRIVSIEMLEHVRNHTLVFERISSWLKPEGQFFAHVFSHKKYTYPFETDGDKDWMARYFFTGGLMPSHDLFKTYDQHLEVVQDWTVDGRHYQKTLDAWLRKMEANKDEVMDILNKNYGDEADCWYHRWRMFFMACSELFGYDKGSEWGVSHYLFKAKK